ncbi:MAG: hypothetical protein EBT03_08455, partial [Betaproteobacteria bacterium]|nr:hypothetical protein [Betaproteobacteria bacterium]
MLGEVRASKFIGVLQGNGALITSINPDGMMKPVGLMNGGTGLSGVVTNSILYGSPSKNAMSSVILKAGNMLYGGVGGEPVSGELRSGVGMVVVTDDAGVMIKHGDTSSQESMGLDGGGVIQSIMLDDFGHITAMSSVDLDGRYVQSSSVSDQFITRQGGVLEKPIVMASQGSLTTTRNGNIVIMPNGSGKVGIGTENPSQKLEVMGGVRIGDTVEGVPGTLRYNGSTGRFEGYNGLNEWVNLDVQTNTAGGWSDESGRVVVMNSTSKVGVGTYAPEEKLDVRGRVYAQEGVRTSGDVVMSRSGRVMIGNRGIGEGVLLGDWEVSGNRVRVNELVGNSVVVSGSVSAMEGIRVGNVWEARGDGKVSGSVEFLNGVVTSRVTGRGGVLELNPEGVVRLGRGMEVSGNEWVGNGERELGIRGNGKGVMIEGSMWNNGRGEIPGGVRLGGVVEVDAERKSMSINYPTSRTDASVYVSGNIIVGDVGDVSGGMVDRSNMFIDGNLIVGGTVVNNATRFNTLSVDGGSSIGTQSDAKVTIGPRSDSQNGKFNIKTSGSSSGRAIDVRNGNNTQILVVQEDGMTGIGVENPSGFLTIRGGTSGRPSMRVMPGTLVATSQVGAVENDGMQMYYTDQQGVRHAIVAGSITQNMSNKIINGSVIGDTKVSGTMVFSGGGISVGEGRNLVIATNGGGVGIGTSQPAAYLDVSGSIRVGDSGGSSEGTIRYSGGRFYGYDGTKWKELDAGPEDGLFKYTGIAKIGMYTTGNIGIGVTRPTTALEVSGTVSANMFIGDGSQLRNIPIGGVSGSMSVVQGGTGVKVIPAGGIMVGNGTEGIKSVGLVDVGKVLMGSGSSTPTSGYLVAGEGITIVNGLGVIQIGQSGEVNIATTNVYSDGWSVGQVNVDRFGRIQRIEGKNLDNRYYPQAVSDGQYFRKSGGTISGQLRFSSGGSNIVSDVGTISIIASGNGYVGIGTSQPRMTLDVAGGVRVGNSSENVAGTLRYNGSVFQGYNGSEWRTLDATTTFGTTINAVGYVGDGSGITNLNPGNLSSVVPVTRGGTGTSNVAVGSVLVGNGNSVMKAVGIGMGQVLMGSGSSPVGGSIVGVGPIVVNATATGTITIGESGSGVTAGSVELSNDLTIGGLGVDVYGRVTTMSVRSLDDRYYTKEQVDVRISGGSGAVVSQGTVYSGGVVDITTGYGENLVIVPSGNGRVGVGTTVPNGYVSIGGVNNGVSGTTGGSQLYLGGSSTSGVNIGGKKLYIGDYDNGGSIVYPVYVEDKGGNADFWVRNRSSINGSSSGYFSGRLFVGQGYDESVASGTVVAKAFVGDGSRLSGIRFESMTGVMSVTNGGTGSSTFTEGGVLYGNGSTGILATPVLQNGQLLIGDGTGVPTIGTLTGTTGQVQVVNGAGTITLSLPQT